MILHDYFRSSAAYRVRIALNLKGLDYDRQVVNLVKGEQQGEDYLAVNAQGLVPALALGTQGAVLTQSLAIIEYLEEMHPGPALLPADPLGRARVRALAAIVACDIHPLNNLRVLNYLVQELSLDEDTKLAWYRHWIAQGLHNLEAMLQHPATGSFCHGEEPGLADLCLVPQLYNARRFQCDLSPYPTVVAIDTRCQALEAFQRAHPDAG